MSGKPDSLEQVSATAPAGETPLTVTAVHQQHGKFVWRTLFRLGVRAPHIEDVYQEVFLVVHRRLRSFTGASAITTWLYEICFRVAVGYRRKAHFRREELVSDWSEFNALSAPIPSPEAQVATLRQAKQLERILDAIPLEYRVVFVMFEVEGLSSEVIAESIGVPVGTVYSRLYRARKRFAALLSRIRPEQMENKP